MFISIRGILCPYFLINGPKNGYFFATREYSGIKCLYFSQMYWYRWNKDNLCTYFPVDG
ncbi:hypothetical protein DJ90_5796 [Paenibacillus macerans]|uniref:Uncharacterized protein n=1 Tax=Paenibacillus macerans TaxID=44252 RepID=A0A090ZLK7_PAEMA|nr:hypothetical protein DJ90_5796 [Paenibacillus macerans]